MSKAKIAIVQYKPQISEINANFKTAERLIKSAAAGKPDTIIMPELWATGYYPKPVEEYADEEGQRTLGFLRGLAIECNVNIIGGSVIVSSGGRIYNRSYALNRRGELLAVYDKVHLFSMVGEEEVFMAGEELPIYELEGLKCTTELCYDVRFPEMTRSAALRGVELLFIPAAWSLKRLTHWRILMQARAIENQIFIAAANSAGHSLIINPWGEILNEGEAREQIIAAEIDIKIRSEIKEAMNVLADVRDFSIKI